MPVGAITISIDLELAWGNWDNLTNGHIAHIEASERPIVNRLVELLDAHQLPVTWAFVAALLDPASARGHAGGEHLWYAPDVIERIRSAKVPHDLGSHGGRHIYLDSVSEGEADEDLAFARSVHDRNGLSFASFVFPRNLVGHKAIVRRHGARVYRGTDHAWHQRIRNHQRILGRIADLADKVLPVAPETVRPQSDAGLINLPGSLLFFGRQGVRRFVPARAMKSKLAKGLSSAKRGGGVFHLWFHPSNFWHDTDRQFEIFGAFARHVGDSAARGEIEIKPMSAFA